MKNINFKKTWFLGLFLLSVLLLIWLLGSNNVNQTKTSVGVILPLTGPIASLGESAKNGALLAFNDSNIERKNSIVFEDDHFDPKTTILAYNKLKEINKVNSVVCFASAPCNAIAPLAERDHIILIAIASDPLVQVNKKYVFRLEISPLVESQKIAEYIKTKNFKSISSVVAIQSGVQAAYKGLIDDSNINKLINNSESVNVGERDYRTIISGLLKTNPQAIIVGLLPGDAGNFIKQARELGFAGDFVGFNFIEGEETLKAGGEALEDTVYSQSAGGSVWFNNLYKETYTMSADSGAIHSYDALKILLQAQKKGGKEDAVKYIESLKNYNGASGVFSSDSVHQFTLPVVLKTIRGGQFVKL